MWELFYHKLPRQVASQTKSTPLCECVSESANTVEACTMLRAATNKTEPHTLLYKIASKIVTVRSWSVMYSEGSENMAFYGHKGIFNDLGEDLVSRAPCTICKHLIGHLIGSLKPRNLVKVLSPFLVSPHITSVLSSIQAELDNEFFILENLKSHNPRKTDGVDLCEKYWLKVIWILPFSLLLLT